MGAQSLGKESSLVLPSVIWVMGLGGLVSLHLEKGVPSAIVYGFLFLKNGGPVVGDCCNL